MTVRRTMRESRWYTGKPDQPVSSRIEHWLYDRGSLTAKLVAECQSRCGGKFDVEVVRQSWGKPFNSERRLLGIRDGEVALIREVRLRCDLQPWVFARTLIPVSSFRGRAKRLAFLGNKPLGALLFADPATHRRLMQVSYLQKGQHLFQRAMSGQAENVAAIWGRRTLFEYAGKPLLVNEIFLPGLVGA